MKQISWIYRFEATAFCCILCDAVVEGRATLGSDLSATTAAYSMWAATSLLPSIYDYAGAYKAINPVLYEPASPQISIGLRRPADQESEAFAWRIHARAIHNLWDDNNIL